MTRPKKFNDLRKALLQREGGPEALAKARHEVREALALSALREARGATQVEVAAAIGVTQPNVSRIEHQDDVYLSTLRSYIQAMGGDLEVRAVFDDETIVIPTN